VNHRGTKQKPLTEQWEAINRSRPRVRARREHAFRVGVAPIMLSSA
jgi:hypothetical protein